MIFQFKTVIRQLIFALKKNIKFNNGFCLFKDECFLRALYLCELVPGPWLPVERKLLAGVSYSALDRSKAVSRSCFP